MNKLYYGDNLDILRQYIADDSIDLIYLDPPFNSKRDYSLIFKTPKGHPSEAQITAFEDTWRWGEQAECEYAEILHQPNTDVAEMIQIYFQDEAKGTAKKIVVSVKGGETVGQAMVADLKNTIEREKAQIGLFVTLATPTQPMIAEAASAGFYESPHSGAFPKIQIITVGGLLAGEEPPRYPDLSHGALSFKKAKTENQGEQQSFL